MQTLTEEQADYVMAHYSSLLNLPEQRALRHYKSEVKIEGPDAERLKRVYMRTGWLTDDPVILSYLREGYVKFTLNCANRIVRDNPDKVFFNLCPNCQRLARTPYAKQCRFCKYNWH
ncbi:hypothetical protein FPZ42_08925 [Mucilaginibacter achroorhodeus]|uniref:Uncharacterized protein n=1 Tax=Mucilaginibacter achroorhodeus TaxID=2599294 RepID=A0A563U743_9SPHI|nr:hypothetical protein [Mucilaginibacter achroorhodeus]TWR27144.1 hypothetical protein FPZ42_08925 [Mucilaginibacter achroorhodeus]